MKATRILAAVALITALCAGAAPAAHAEEPDRLQSQVDALLAEFAGGTQTGTGEISWDDGDVVLTLAGARDFTRSVGTCPTGSFCAYSGSNLGGNRLAFASCTGANSVAPLGRVYSFANARSTGIVYAYSPAGAVGSAAPGNWANTTAAVSRLGC